MHILKLQAENVKRLVAVTVEPDGNVINITGKNAQGKSSLLDSIMYAFGGKKTYPKSLIRDGEDQAIVTINIEGYTIQRIINRNKADKLKITNADGMSDSKESFLKDLCGTIGLAFDPSEFVRQDDKKQLKTLKDVVGLDFSELEQKRSDLYTERTQINACLKNQKTLVETLPLFPEAPTGEVSSSDLMAEYEAAQKSQTKIEQQENTLERHRYYFRQYEQKEDGYNKTIENEKDRIVSLEEQIEAAKKAIKDAENLRCDNGTEKEQHIEGGKKMVADLEEIKKAAIDPDPIKERMAQSEEINRQVRANKAYEEAEEQAKKFKKMSDDLTAQIDKVDQEKEAQLKAAKFPVDGLSFDSEGVLYNGVPFGQASQAERIKVSVSIAAALNPKLRIALIRDGSLLDSESMELLKKIAEEKNMQIWIESVMDEKEAGCIFIEDGSAV